MGVIQGLHRLQLARRIGSRQEATIQNQGLAGDERGAEPSTATRLRWRFPRAFQKRPMGRRPSANFFASGAPHRRSPIRVSITAGHTTFTRKPLRAVSSAADLVSAITPCLLAQYVAAPAEPMKPATDASLRPH